MKFHLIPYFDNVGRVYDIEICDKPDPEYLDEVYRKEGFTIFICHINPSDYTGGAIWELTELRNKQNQSIITLSDANVCHFEFYCSSGLVRFECLERMMAFMKNRIKIEKMLNPL